MRTTTTNIAKSPHIKQIINKRIGTSKLVYFLVYFTPIHDKPIKLDRIRSFPLSIHLLLGAWILLYPIRVITVNVHTYACMWYDNFKLENYLCFTLIAIIYIFFPFWFGLFSALSLSVMVGQANIFLLFPLCLSLSLSPFLSGYLVSRVQQQIHNYNGSSGR